MSISVVFYTVAVGLGLASYINGRLVGPAVAALALAIMLTGR